MKTFTFEIERVVPFYENGKLKPKSEIALIQVVKETEDDARNFLYEILHHSVTRTKLIHVM